MARSPVAFGRYIITRRIARGGMAEIFRARMRGRSDWVALKLMRPSLGHESLREELFQREARIAERIDHPNVVRLVESGIIDERAFIAMEFVRGRDLSQVLSPTDGRERLAAGAFAFELGMYIGLEVARGLGHAHRLRGDRGEPLGIVHRDISPGNVMLGYDGSVKLLDFGVARMNESHGIRTQTGTLRGKFAYMSPEQTLGEAIDARSDVFSLGTVLYELLTGANPFRAKSPLKTLEKVQRVRPVPPSRAHPNIPREVDEVLARCLAKDRRRRFADAAELAEAIAGLGRRLGLLGRDELSAFLVRTFDAERRAEERELAEEDEEAALIEVVDFDLRANDPALDAGRVLVSASEEVSEDHRSRASLDQAALEEVEFGVFSGDPPRGPGGPEASPAREEGLDPGGPAVDDEGATEALLAGDSRHPEPTGGEAASAGGRARVSRSLAEPTVPHLLRRPPRTDGPDPLLEALSQGGGAPASPFARTAHAHPRLARRLGLALAVGLVVAAGLGLWLRTEPARSGADRGLRVVEPITIQMDPAPTEDPLPEGDGVPEGTLELRGTAGLTIEVAGRRLGKKERLLRLPAGAHALRLVYPNGEERVLEVRIEADRRTVFAVPR